MSDKRDWDFVVAIIGVVVVLFAYLAFDGWMGQQRAMAAIAAGLVQDSQGHWIKPAPAGVEKP